MICVFRGEGSSIELLEGAFCYYELGSHDAWWSWFKDRPRRRPGVMLMVIGVYMTLMLEVLIYHPGPPFEYCKIQWNYHLQEFAAMSGRCRPYSIGFEYCC